VGVIDMRLGEAHPSDHVRAVLEYVALKPYAAGATVALLGTALGTLWTMLLAPH
jgi:hypothetical protein